MHSSSIAYSGNFTQRKQTIEHMTNQIKLNNNLII